MENISSVAKGHKTLPFSAEGKQFEWNDQYITGLQVKQAANLPLDGELYLSISEPWKDEPVNDGDLVDLARPGLEQFFIKQKLKYTINCQEFETNKQYIKGGDIRRQGAISADDEIFLSIKGPWEDELIKDEQFVDLARPGIENFFSKEKLVQVVLIVNGREKSWVEKTITFDQVASLAFGVQNSNPNTIYTVTYAKGPKENPEGSMVKGDKIIVKHKMVFNVTATNKS
ncbi:multiubiquitin domain-containing protein [Segetibacter koreensis]|uniref:multiubiquitin domain-containing protein n=1 Tax=Segetibacter koreensis TaxID=398037 RepID=UPI0003613C8B|nr:multiubiquitin domain-containing protein [Segetibacter koreensis]